MSKEQSPQVELIRTGAAVLKHLIHTSDWYQLVLKGGGNDTKQIGTLLSSVLETSGEHIKQAFIFTSRLLGLHQQQWS